MIPTQVAVTGAFGYLGRHLMSLIDGEKFSITPLGHKPRSKGDRTFADVTNYNEVLWALNGCGAIVHLACSSLQASREAPLLDFQVNALGTANVLEAARHLGVRKVIIASSAQIYGLSGQIPQSEDQICSPHSPYATSKLCAETIALNYARNYSMKTICMRLFNVYGSIFEDTKRETVETIFIRRVLRGQEPVVHPNPGEGRDFVHVRDVVRAIEAALAYEGSEVFNVGTGRMTTMLELAEMIIRLSGKDLQPTIKSTGDRAFQLQADTKKTREMLKFQASISLEEGLREIFSLERKKLDRSILEQDTDHQALFWV